MNRHRVLQIANHYLEPGGEEASVERIAERLGEMVSLERCLFESRQWAGASAPSAFNQARWMLKNPAALERIRALDAAAEPNVWLVHNVFPVASAGVYSLARQMRRPIIQYLHNFRPLSINGYQWANGKISAGGVLHPYLKEIAAAGWQDSRLKTAWFGLVLSWLQASGAQRSIKAWVAVSEFVRQKFVEAGVPSDRIFVIPHSWDLRNETLERAEEGGYYLFLGRLNEQKGIRALIKAWTSLRGKLGNATPKLKIAGSGPLLEWVQDKCSASGDISYAGHISGDEKDRLLRGARALISPSVSWEALGLVTYEAYDYGKPMLAARSGGLTETVIHGETGLLHDPGNYQELADQVSRLEESQEIRSSMGTAGRVWLVKNTGAEGWKRKFAHVLDFVRGEKGRDS